MNERVQSQAKAVKSSSFTPSRSGLLQRKCACGGTPGVDGQCTECRKKRLQADQFPAPSIVEDVLRSAGQPLDPTTRAFMEPRFGHDFSRVRVYADDKAAESARAVEANAYTVGNNVVFGAGQYAPQTNSGRQLIAHELSHTLQQGAASAAIPHRLMVGAPNNPFEQEADTASAAVLQGTVEASPRASAVAPQVQRQGPTVQPIAPPTMHPIAPTKLITSEVEDVTFPKDDEITLDKRIANRRNQDAPDGKGKYIGTVNFKNLPAAEKKVAGEEGKEAAGEEANLERRAVKHALLEAIITDIEKKAGIEMRLRVPLENSPAPIEYAMVILRFDKQRNVEVEYAGKDVQAKGSLADPSSGISKLASEFGVTFVTDGITVTNLPGTKGKTTFTGKNWSANDVVLLRDALPLLGSTERQILKGCKIRRLNAKTAGTAAGFFYTGDNSINLSDAALPFDKAIWFGEGGKFYTRGVHTSLHEIGHALHYAKVPAGSPKGISEMLDQFKKAVLDESKKRTKGKTGPGSKFPPQGIITPTEYAATSWKEFFADTYSIYITNPSFLNTTEFMYLYDFFKHHFP
jgi:hypothetical protein